MFLSIIYLARKRIYGKVTLRFSFVSGRFCGLLLIGLDWVGLGCIGLDWVALGWVDGLDCIGFGCMDQEVRYRFGTFSFMDGFEWEWKGGRRE